MRGERAEMDSIDSDDNLHTFGESEVDDDQGEDFDDFEAGAGDADFGDFDDGFEQPSFSTDRSSESHQVGSTEQVVSSTTAPFVSASIARNVALAPRLSSFGNTRYMLSVADLRSFSSPFLISASLARQTIWSPLARHILIPSFPPLRYRGLLLYPPQQRSIRSSSPIEASHCGHSLWLHHLCSLQTGSGRASAVCF